MGQDALLAHSPAGTGACAVSDWTDILNVGAEIDQVNSLYRAAGSVCGSESSF